MLLSRMPRPVAPTPHPWLPPPHPQVYNLTTYPHLVGFFEELGVDTEPSEMSFALSVRRPVYSLCFARRCALAILLVPHMPQFRQEARVSARSTSASQRQRVRTCRPSLATGSTAYGRLRGPEARSVTGGPGRAARSCSACPAGGRWRGGVGLAQPRRGLCAAPQRRQPLLPGHAARRDTLWPRGARGARRAVACAALRCTVVRLWWWQLWVLAAVCCSGGRERAA